MFKVAEKTELNQISLTGIRALVLIGLLIVRPRSLEEIRNTFIDLQIMEPTHSDDILRIDLNTIKLMGCEVSRSSAKTDYKYVLTKHPFALKIPKEELLALKKVYNLIKQKLDLETLIEFHEMFNRIASHIYDEESKEAIYGISVLRYFDLDYIKTLMLDCRNNNTLDLEYKKVISKNSTKKQIVAQKLVHNNDKIYLYGYDLDKKEHTVLNLRGIETIYSHKVTERNIEIKQFEIKFVLRRTNENILDKTEAIIDRTEDGLLVKGIYHNEFLAMQRVLSFGAKCTVLEPLVFRNKIIEKIKEMRKVYEC